MPPLGTGSTLRTPPLLHSCPRYGVLTAVKTAWKNRHNFVLATVYLLATILQICVLAWSNGPPKMRRTLVFQVKRWPFRRPAQRPYHELSYLLFELLGDNLSSSTKREHRI